MKYLDPNDSISSGISDSEYEDNGAPRRKKRPLNTNTAAVAATTNGNGTAAPTISFSSPFLPTAYPKQPVQQRKKKIPMTEEERQEKEKNSKLSQVQRNFLKPRLCRFCGVTNSPAWRSGPHGSGTLCNACGTKFKTGRLIWKDGALQYAESKKEVAKRKLETMVGNFRTSEKNPFTCTNCRPTRKRKTKATSADPSVQNEGDMDYNNEDGQESFVGVARGESGEINSVNGDYGDVVSPVSG